jgi:PPOX class probable F420-dependent enzyme
MAEDWTVEFRSLLDAPSPAVLTTTRKDGRALSTPVWFRWFDGAFEIVIAKGDVKLGHLARNPECTLVVFETVPPFRGIEVRGTPELLDVDVTEARTAISGRYLGAADGVRYAAGRRSKPGILVRFRAEAPRVWDLRSMLPS